MRIRGVALIARGKWQRRLCNQGGLIPEPVRLTCTPDVTESPSSVLVGTEIVSVSSSRGRKGFPHIFYTNTITALWTVFFSPFGTSRLASSGDLANRSLDTQPECTTSPLCAQLSPMAADLSPSPVRIQHRPTTQRVHPQIGTLRAHPGFPFGAGFAQSWFSDFLQPSCLSFPSPTLQCSAGTSLKAGTGWTAASGGIRAGWCALATDG